MVGAGNDPRGVRGRHLRHVRRLPCSHASHPCAGELLSPSMIQAYKGKYQRLWAPCTGPHTSWTGDGLPPLVCPCDSIYRFTHTCACSDVESRHDTIRKMPECNM